MAIKIGITPKDQKLVIFGASVKGEHHVKNKTDSQDVWGYKHINSDASIIVVSDGAGSSKEGRLGAELVVNSIIGIIEKSSGLKRNNLQESVKGAIYYAREVLEGKSLELEIELKEFASTLIILLVNNEGHAFIGHIGDGAVVGKIKGKLEIVSEPEKSEYVNETTFLTSDGWKSALRLTEVKKFNSLAIFTDGIQRGVLIKEGKGYLPYENFFNPLFDYASEVKDEQKASEDVEKLLKSENFQKISEDDKTLVAVSNLEDRL